MSNFSEGNSFEEILSRCLARVDDNLDKRQGSIIYDALAPACAELAQAYIALDVYTDQTYLLNAVGINLDNRVVDYGLKREQATYAQRKITVYDTTQALMDIEIGSRFSIPNEYGGYNFTVTARLDIGYYVVTCETAGTAGNDYVGELLPLIYINNLGNAVIGDVIKPGENEETDDELRKRALLKINQEAFAGNKAAYKQMVEALDGVEVVKIFPVWDGGGTVKLAILASDYTIPTSSFIDELQEIIDPTDASGEGVGLAPIGHEVTVEAPVQLDIDIAATISIVSGYTLQQVTPEIEAAIELYIKEIQKEWADKDTLTVYISRMTAAILSVPQVQNVSAITINESSSDLVINITASDVKYPVLGDVIISES